MTWVKDATRALIDCVSSRDRVEPVQRVRARVLAAHLRITEIAEAPKWVVSAYLPSGSSLRDRRYDPLGL